jgi:hypothetical protein
VKANLNLELSFESYNVLNLQILTRHLHILI